MATKGLYIGRRIRFQVADGYAEYEIDHIGPRKVHLMWVNTGGDMYQDAVLGRAGEIDRSMLESMVEYDDSMVATQDENTKFYAGLHLGRVLHYQHSHGQFVRCEVVERNGKKVLLPFEMVGDWRPYDVKWDSYHVKGIKEKRTFAPHFTSIYEGPVPQYMRGISGNPTNLKAIPLPDKPWTMPGRLRIMGDDDAVVITPTVYSYATGNYTTTPVADELIAVLRNKSIRPLKVRIELESGEVIEK